MTGPAQPNRAPAQLLAQLLAGAWLARAISVAARLEIADLVAATPRTATEIAAATGCHPGAVHRLLRGLAQAGLFEEDGAGRFALGALGAPLRTQAPDSIHAYAVMAGERWVWQSMGTLDYSVRTGRPAFDHLFGSPVFEYYAANPEAGRIGAEGLRSIGRGQDAAVAGAWEWPTGTVVDVGGGQGGLMAAILDAHPGLSGILVDLPHVADSARRRLHAAGLADRCRVEAGDFFRAVPQRGDIYVLRKVVHDWDDDRACAVLRTCRAAMGAAAHLLLVEMVVPAGNTPSYAKLLDLLMLAYTGGRERTEQEYHTLLCAAGFELRRVIATASSLSMIEAVPT